MLKKIKSTIKYVFNLFGIKIGSPDFSYVTKNKLKNAPDDDFNWVTYNDHYRNEMENGVLFNTLKLKEGGGIM
ncbi:MAG: hypothetical protein A3J93_01165 [Candidatus Magasanikbacteria bacterium RIFOXYC2_FULL_42_28]|uniref:Uncharacterized protein n=1 Tax=Candidatus Magasanikbacteria bacterium RIFOXYC2_FULL_42_28 TaxID=1798704 RepID=A0A1F6NXT3_9BACT|nr:MAG: hypothetical protein A3J93_01165 [Candidatus Magasanikbacteria bacterium RIFOXYC2_FULL_42_28]